MQMALRLSLSALFASAAAGAALPETSRPSLSSWKATALTEKATAKVTPVEKVLTLLQDLQTKVANEGEEEAATYNKFACFCKDTTSDKTQAIESGKDSQSKLVSAIETLNRERATLDTTIATLEEDIKAAQATVAQAVEQRAAELKEFEINQADLTAALGSLRGAIASLKASKTPSLVQVQGVAQTVRSALLLADALGMGGERTRTQVAVLLQQAPEVQMENYDFKSGDIIATLETLLASFQSQHTAVEAAEVKAIADHDALVQEQTDIIAQKTKQLDNAQKSKSEKQVEIGTNTQRLTTVSATLLDDQQYLQELNEMCADRATTWDQRSKIRQDELSALTAAITIIKGQVEGRDVVRLAQQGMSLRIAQDMARDPASMAAIESAAEAVDSRVGRRASFLQLRSRRSRRSTGAGQEDPDAEGRQMVVNLLRNSGLKLKSTALTALASKIGADPLAKVKVLIQELIERLLKEANNESNHKAWCDKSIADGEQKRDYAAQAVERLNGNMAELEGIRNTLNEELKVLAAEIEDIKAKQAQAQTLREAEKAENEAAVADAEEGLEATDSAIEVLSQFYKTAEKATVALLQRRGGPAGDAPEAGFAAGEAYTGSQGAATGILGMLDVISGDFKRTIKVTQQAEADAEAEYLHFQTESGKSLAEKEAAEAQKTSQRDDASEELAAATENFNSQSEILNTAIEELLQLQPVCVHTGQTYEERVARRQDEMAALKKALCVLDNFGPGGAKGEC